MKLTDFYQLIVWDISGSDPVIVKDERKISRERVVKLRSFYESKGYEVRSWPLNESEI